MAGYYGYRRRRYYRRGYRRGYRRYGGTSLRRYRSVQMNDNETKVMTFTSVLDGEYSFTGNGFQRYTTTELLAGRTSIDGVVDPNAGRAFFAGMMFDRLRFRSVSVTIRPKVMPSSSATNYVVYAAWDRYGVFVGDGSDTDVGTYSIRTDPSAKQVVWTPGGSGTPLRTWIYSTTRDRYQYHRINHADSLVTWSITVPRGTGDETAAFYPNLLLGFEAVTTSSTVIQYTVLVRMTVEFQGGYSSTSLNYTPSSAAAAAASSTVPLERRIAALESKYNSNPADNNDDFVSVLNELSNPQ